MSWITDIEHMYNHYGITDCVNKFDKDKLTEYLKFRIRFLEEELDELVDATEAEHVVDALIDLIVVALGTLESFQVNSDIAWKRVHEANLNKQPGIKSSRPNPLGLPDLIKNENWIAPCHKDNVGLLSQIEFPIKLGLF